MKANELSGWTRVVACTTLFLTFLSAVSGQTQINLGTQGRNVDFTNAPYTKPIRSGTSLPGGCSAGEFFFNTGATAGQNLFACLGSTWTLMAAPSGLPDPGTNGFIKRIGTNATTAVAAPNGTVVGTTDVQTLTGKSIDASEINSGILTAGRLPALTGDVTTPSGSNVTSLATVMATPGTVGDANHTLQLYVDGKGRVTSVNALPIATNTIVNTTTGTFGAANQIPVITVNGYGQVTSVTTASLGGTSNAGNSASAVTSGALNAIPSSCSAGALYFSTDQPAGQQLYVCSASNTWSQSLSLGNSGALAFTNGALDIVSTVLPRLSAANHFTGSNQLDGTTTLNNVSITGTCTGCNSSGFANPMTTLGDQIVGGTNGAAIRAAVGAPGQVWTVSNAGQPVWASPAVPPVTNSYASLTQDNNGVLNITNSAGQGATITEHAVAGQGLSHTYDMSAIPGGINMLQYWSASDFSYGIFLQSNVNKTFERYHPPSGAFFTDLGIQLNTTGAQPACDANHRGELWFIQAASGSEDGLQVCHQTSNGFAWKVVF